MRALRIGNLAERTGTTVATIRYYEQVGLLRPAPRSGGQRLYDNEDERRLAFIRRCREFDLSIEEIRALLSLVQRRQSCTEARKLAERHLVELRRKLALASCAGMQHCLADHRMRVLMRWWRRAGLRDPQGALRGQRKVATRQTAASRGCACTGPNTSSKACRSAMSTSSMVTGYPRSTRLVTP